MKIEAGKSYRNGNGEKINIKLIDQPFIDQCGRMYDSDGNWSHRKTGKDIVSEWTDPITFECEWNNGSFLSLFGTDEIKKLQPFIGKKTKVTIEVIE